MKKQGFTLIELLAVIAILSILVILAVPKVLQLFEDAKKNAFKVEAQNIVKAAEQGYATKLFKGNIEETTYTYVDGIETKTGNISLNISGKKIQNGEIIITIDGKISLTINNGKYCAIKSSDSNEITISEDIENCKMTVFTEFTLTYENASFNKIIAVNGEYIVGGIIWIEEEESIVTLIIKYSSIGEKIWELNYENVDFRDVVKVSDGIVLVAGKLGEDNSLVVKYNTFGEKVWEKTYFNADFSGIVADGDEVVAYGSSNNNPFIVKYSASGDKLWEATNTIDGYIAVGGKWDIPYYAIIVKYNTSGEQIWEKSYTIENTNGSYSSVFAAYDGYIANGSCGTIVKYSTVGNILWDTSSDYSSFCDTQYHDAVIKNDEFISVGSIYGSKRKAVIVKYNASGEKVWENIYEKTIDQSYFANLVPMDDGYIVMGKFWNDDGDNALIIKYNTSGEKVWEKTYENIWCDQFIYANGGYVGIGVNDDYEAVICAIKY